jgi:sugar lactone lactonase YvrE
MKTPTFKAAGGAAGPGVAAPAPARRAWRGALAVCAFGLLCTALLWIYKEPLKRFGLIQPLYLRYSQWRYNWRSPAEMGNGLNARAILLDGPMGLAEDRFGNMYVSDREARLVWQIAPSGQAQVIAGSGRSTDARLGVPAHILAREADFASPEGLAVDAEGNLYLADSWLHAVFKIDRAGWRTLYAGSGQQGYSGDGGPATAARLWMPYDLRFDAQGNLFISDVYNNVIRKVDRAGLITTFAGTGQAGFSGDGGPATQAQLRRPYGMLFDAAQNLLITDSENDRIRRVGHDGLITTIAGSGVRGYAGDGGPASQAQFNVPQSLALDAQGRLYIGDEHNHAIRAVEPDGTVRTVVGGPQHHGYAGDGGPAAAARIADPENMWLRADGSLLITMGDNSRVRIITPAGVINTWAGRGPSAKHKYQP